MNKGTKIKKETRSLLKGKWDSHETSKSSFSSVGLIDHRPTWASHLYAPGTLVETCSAGDRITKRKTSNFPRLDSIVGGGVVAMNMYVRMDSSALPEEDTIILRRMNNIRYRDGDRELREYPRSPYSKELLPVGALGLVHSYVRVGADSNFRYLEESVLPDLDDANFYIVFFYEWLDVVKSGHYLIPVKETKKAEPRKKYVDGIAIEPW